MWRWILTTGWNIAEWHRYYLLKVTPCLENEHLERCFQFTQRSKDLASRWHVVIEARYPWSLLSSTAKVSFHYYHHVSDNKWYGSLSPYHCRYSLRDVTSISNGRRTKGVWCQWRVLSLGRWMPVTDCYRRLRRLPASSPPAAVRSLSRCSLPSRTWHPLHLLIRCLPLFVSSSYVDLRRRQWTKLSLTLSLCAQKVFHSTKAVTGAVCWVLKHFPEINVKNNHVEIK